MKRFFGPPKSQTKLYEISFDDLGLCRGYVEVSRRFLAFWIPLAGAFRLGMWSILCQFLAQVNKRELRFPWNECIIRGSSTQEQRMRQPETWQNSLYISCWVRESDGSRPFVASFGILGSPAQIIQRGKLMGYRLRKGRVETILSSEIIALKFLKYLSEEMLQRGLSYG